MRTIRFITLFSLSIWLVGCNARCNVGGSETLDIADIEVDQTAKENGTRVDVRFRINGIQAESAGSDRYRVKVVGIAELQGPDGKAIDKSRLEKPLEQTDDKKLDYATLTFWWEIPKGNPLFPPGQYTVLLTGKDEVAKKEVKESTTFTLK